MCPVDPYKGEGMIVFPRRRLGSTVPAYESGLEGRSRSRSLVDPDSGCNGSRSSTTPHDHDQHDKREPKKREYDPSYTRWAPFSSVLDRKGNLRIIKTGVFDGMDRVASAYGSADLGYSGTRYEDGERNRTKTGMKGVTDEDEDERMGDIFGEEWGKKGGWAGLAGYPPASARGVGVGSDRHRHDEDATTSSYGEQQTDQADLGSHPADPDPGPLGELAPDYTYALSQRDPRVEWARGKVGLFVGESGSLAWSRLRGWRG